MVKPHWTSSQLRPALSCSPGKWHNPSCFNRFCYLGVNSIGFLVHMGPYRIWAGLSADWRWHLPSPSLTDSSSAGAVTSCSPSIGWSDCWSVCLSCLSVKVLFCRACITPTAQVKPGLCQKRRAVQPCILRERKSIFIISFKSAKHTLF